MLAYEIHVAGHGAHDDAERVRDALERACGETIDSPVTLDMDLSVPIRALLIPQGVEWSFDRLREVIGELRSASHGSTVTLQGQPDTDQELVDALVRQGRILLAQGRKPRARALMRQAEILATDERRSDAGRMLWDDE